MIKLIIFDVGGVVIDFQEDYYVADLAKREGLSKRELERFVFPLIDSMELGRITLKEVERMFSKRFNIHFSHLRWIGGWKKFAKVDNDVVSLIEKLSKNYKICMITNNSRTRYGAARKMVLGKLARSGAVSDIVSSCYVHMRKPNVGIYKYSLKRFGATAKESIFIDNFKENVIGAEKAGIKSIVYTSYPQLVSDLEKMGVL